MTITAGTVTKNQSNVIQGSSPNPFAFENRLSTGYPAIGLNGISLDFYSSTTGVKEMGIYVGDLESRLSIGTAGSVIVFDVVGAVLADLPIEGLFIPNPEQVDFEISKAVDDMTPNVGQEITFILQIAN